MRNIHIQRVFHAPREAVWSALTDRDALAAWLMPNDVEPRIGHRFTFRTDPAPGFDGVVHSEVLTIDPPRLLVLSWRGGGLDTTLRVEHSPHVDGTLLVLRHEGFRSIRQLLPRIVLGIGWARLLRDKLPSQIKGVKHAE